MNGGQEGESGGRDGNGEDMEALEPPDSILSTSSDFPTPRPLSAEREGAEEFELPSMEELIAWVDEAFRIYVRDVPEMVREGLCMVNLREWFTNEGENFFVGTTSAVQAILDQMLASEGNQQSFEAIDATKEICRSGDSLSEFLRGSGVIYVEVLVGVCRFWRFPEHVGINAVRRLVGGEIDDHWKMRTDSCYELFFDFNGGLERARSVH